MYLWIAILLAVAGAFAIASEVPSRRLSSRLPRRWRIITGSSYIIVSGCIAVVAFDRWPEGAARALTVAGLVALGATGIMLLAARDAANQSAPRHSAGALPLIVAIAGQIIVGFGYLLAGRTNTGWIVFAAGVAIIAVGCGLAFRAASAPCQLEG
jgi:uncharacterized membrane protein YedE/YeeE